MATIRKLKRKNTSTPWQAIIRRKGHRPKYRQFRTKKEATSWAQAEEAAIDGGAASLEVLRRMEVSEFLGLYREHFPERITRTADTNLRALAALGHHRVLDLQTRDLITYAKERKKTVGPATIAGEISILSAVYRRLAVHFGVTLRNPAKEARPALSEEALIARSTERKRRPSAEELERLVAFFRDNRFQLIPLHEIIAFAVETAMRLSEITRITWPDFDAEARTVVIRQRKDPKNKQNRDEVIPLSPQAVEIIERQPRRRIEIFPHKAKSISTAFTRACIRLHIEDLNFHDLRHEGVSRLFERGLSIPEVALISGHRDWRSLKRYTNLKPEDVEKKLREGYSL